jgi:hypothetical protein
MIKNGFIFKLKVSNVVVSKQVMSSSFFPSWPQVILDLLAPLAFKGACFDDGTWSDDYAAQPQQAMLPFFGLTLLLKRKTRKTLQDTISVIAAPY